MTQKETLSLRTLMGIRTTAMYGMECGLLSLQCALVRFCGFHMSIVGYGDYYPQSHPGRLIIIFTSFWGVFLISMCIVSVGNYRNFYSTEKQVRLSAFSVQAFKILFRLKMRHQL